MYSTFLPAQIDKGIGWIAGENQLAMPCVTGTNFWYSGWALVPSIYSFSDFTVVTPGVSLILNYPVQTFHRTSFLQTAQPRTLIGVQCDHPDFLLLHSTFFVRTVISVYITLCRQSKMCRSSFSRSKLSSSANPTSSSMALSHPSFLSLCLISTVSFTISFLLSLRT